MELGIGDGVADEQRSAATEGALPTEHNGEMPSRRVLGLRNVVVAFALFSAGLLTLFGFQMRLHIDIAGVSSAPHFVYQAQSFFQGRWDINLPSEATDVVVLDGKTYMVYPPLPALLLMPFVAIFGVNTSDILFTAALSAANLSLLFLLLEQARAVGLTRRIWLENVVISILCWYGSMTLFLSLGGEVWFTEHIVAMTCALLSLLLSLRRHFTWSALLLGCAVFSRATLLLAFPLLFFLAWQESPTDNLFARVGRLLSARRLDWHAVPWRRLAGPTLVLGLVVLLFLSRNWAEFGSPFESGYGILVQQRYPQVRDGLFSLSYVPANLLTNFFGFPNVLYSSPFDRMPRIDWVNGGIGTSVFLTRPLFLLLFWRNRRFSPVHAALWITTGLIVACALLFLATGWLQFGARYLFDAYPFAFLLLALNDIRVDWRFEVLGLLGALVNIMGALQFWHHV